MKIIWCMVSWDIRHERQEFFCYFGHFLSFDPPNNQKIKILKKWKVCRYYHFTLVYHKWHEIEFFCYFGHFLSFDPPNNQKIKILKKWKVCRYYHFTLVYHKWHDMMYAFWDMKCDWQCFVILDHFLHFCPTNNPEN